MGVERIGTATGPMSVLARVRCGRPGTYREHMAKPRLFAYAFALLVAAFVVGGVALVTQAPSATTYFAVATALGLFPLGLGLLIAQRRPTNLVGPLLALNGLVVCDLVVEGGAAQFVVAQFPGVLPVSSLYLAIEAGTWMFLYVPPALLMLSSRTAGCPAAAGAGSVRPRGRAGALPLPAAADPAPSRRRSPTCRTVPAAGPARPLSAIVGLALLPVLLGLLVASAASMVVRYRRASDVVAGPR